jgi:hypothetical protein
MPDAWHFVKRRTADPDGGAVYVSGDGRRYRRTGGDALRAEAEFQRHVGALGYPVPRVLETGVTADGDVFVVEESLGERTLHDVALSTSDDSGALPDDVVDTAARVGAMVLRAQAAHPVAGGPEALRAWVREAGWTGNVFAENPDLDTARVRAALDRAAGDLADVPLVCGHLDYGLPNVLPAGVIDWQHHGTVPLGYDVAPTLEIVPFKGGTKGYAPSPAQRHRYLAALDAAAGLPVSAHLGPYLLVKALFFLALMKPAGARPADARPADARATGKHLKWHYRRHLFLEGLAQYERTGTIDPARFPTLATFAARHDDAGDPRP